MCFGPDVAGTASARLLLNRLMFGQSRALVLNGKYRLPLYPDSSPPRWEEDASVLEFFGRKPDRFDKMKVELNCFFMSCC